MNHARRAMILASLVLPCATVANAGQIASEIKPVPIATLAGSISVRYEMFTLANGLQVVVQPDPTVQTVTIGVEYAVGSSAEMPGRTGFAHLFEHLMFNGSENAPEDFSVPMQALGATINGVTQADRTAYLSVVPTPGLERALFLESDRMGYLLGAINQTELDEQRGVVQNEKRMKEGQPLVTMRQRIASHLYPADHPYAHELFGSMADLDAADLDDVRAFFRAHYAPNNAVLSLTGDIDVPTARRLVEKYFGAIPAGPRSRRPPAPVPTLPKRVDDTATDRVATPYLYRAWAVPGTIAPDAAAFTIAAGTMTMPDGTPVREQLIERDRLFTSLFIALEQYDAGGTLSIHGSVAPGIDPAAAGRALDTAIAAAVHTAPTRAAIERFLTAELTARIQHAALPGGGINRVVDGLRLGKGPDWYARWLDTLTAQTPESVSAAAKRWLDRPVYALTVLPGAPPPPEPVTARTAPAPLPPSPIAVTSPTRGPLPPVGAFTDVTFPKAEHARLNNGIEIVYLRNAGAPLTELQIEFDAGTVADPVAARGTHAMLIDLLSAGTTSRDAATITRLGEQMGAGITFEADTDRTTASLSVPTANLQPGLFLIADMLRNTAFAPAALATARAAMHAAQAESGQGDGLFEQAAQQRTNPNSPYARRAGPRDAGVLDALTGDDFRAVRDAWLRPEKATVFVVSNAPFADVRAMLERSLGDWRGTGAAGAKDAATAPPPAVPGIVLIDRPGTDQAIIAGVQALPAPSPDTLLAARVADTALAGDGMGRIIDDLRESKGWTYSVNSMFAVRPLGVEYRISAPVQHDKAGAAIASMRDHLADFTGTKPMTHTEFTVAIDNRIRAMAVELSGATAFMGAIRSNRRLGLPDDADAKLASRYRALTLERARAAFRATVDPAKMVWIVAGDAAVVKPQLASLGLPISVVAQGAPAVP